MGERERGDDIRASGGNTGSPNMESNYPTSLSLPPHAISSCDLLRVPPIDDKLVVVVAVVVMIMGLVTGRSAWLIMC